MKKLILAMALVLGACGVAGAAMELNHLVYISDNNASRVERFYDADNGVVCYVVMGAEFKGPAHGISCVQLAKDCS